jgi:hypothetical protein
MRAFWEGKLDSDFDFLPVTLLILVLLRDHDL